MRPVVFILFILTFMFTASAAIAAGEVRESKTVTPDSKVNVYRLPLDPQERAKALNEIMNGVKPGYGSAFMFNTLFTPSNPEPSSLRPGLILKNQSSPPYRLQGYIMTRDNTGLRAFMYGQRFINNQTEEIATVYAGGSRVYKWVQNGTKKPFEDTVQNGYLEFDGKGAHFFMNAVKLQGVIVGSRMEKLLKETDARQVGVENIRGTRTIVYGIQPTKQDSMNGYRYLQVWVRVGDNKIIRTNLDLTYGREMTEYSKHTTDIRIDDERFLLPGETVNDLVQEYVKVLGPEASQKVLVKEPEKTDGKNSDAKSDDAKEEKSDSEPKEKEKTTEKSK